MTPSTTSELTASLCRALESQHWITVREIAIDDDLDRRCDVVAMLCSGRVTRVDLFEVKISRSDLLADLRREKWRNYLRAGRLWFAMPAKLADPREIPPEAGLMVQQANGWRRVRHPKAGAVEPSLTLMRRLVMAVRSQQQAQAGPRKADLYEVARRARTEQARLVAEVARDVEQYRRWAANAKEDWLQMSRKRDELMSEIRSLKMQATMLLREATA